LKKCYACLLCNNTFNDRSALNKHFLSSKHRNNSPRIQLLHLNVRLNTIAERIKLVEEKPTELWTRERHFQKIGESNDECIKRLTEEREKVKIQIEKLKNCALKNENSYSIEYV